VYTQTVSTRLLLSLIGSYWVTVLCSVNTEDKESFVLTAFCYKVRNIVQRINVFSRNIFSTIHQSFFFNQKISVKCTYLSDHQCHCLPYQMFLRVHISLRTPFLESHNYAACILQKQQL
jgi:hypothetical protein